VSKLAKNSMTYFMDGPLVTDLYCIDFKAAEFND